MGFSRAKADLSDSRFADLRWVSETDSTNADVLRALASESPSDPLGARDLVVVADHQRAGRGRLGRTWEAPHAASLLMTVGTTAVIPDAHRGLLLTAMSCAASEAIVGVCGVRTSIKWPNDLVVERGGVDGGRLKVAGVLAESVPLDGGLTGYAVGIGINCKWAAAEGPLASIATSLDVVSGTTVDREELAVGTIRGFARRLELLESAGSPTALLDEARRLSATLGTEVVVTTPQGRTEGHAVDLDDDGALLVRTGEGVQERVVVGDVVSLRPS
ncbi:MAG: biotin--[acetyl-CoA-carboxylase] ligase [Microthrixaceae bacterium]|nr:biotin--[acetyl-CoA-carboxylase] ligase [Microthrixaceae bacterium]